MNSLCILLLLFLGSVCGSPDFSCNDSRSKICLPNGYNKREPPASTRNISISFELHEVKFNPHEMEMDLSMEIKWRDERIYNVDKEEVSHLGFEFYDHIWKPTLSTVSEKYMSVKHGFDDIRMLNPGNIVGFHRRFKYKITCFMNFNDFPFDKHECSFLVGSFLGKKEYFTTEAIFDNSPWVEVITNIRELSDRESVYILPDGDHSMAGFVITVERRIIKYIVFYYIPCAFISLGVWLMILWGITYEERFLFLVIVSAVLLYILNAASQIIPCSTSDFTLLNIWIMIHVSFVVASFLELKISHWWYVKSFSKRLHEYSTKKSKIDVVYFFIYLILYCVVVGGYLAFCLLA